MKLISILTAVATLIALPLQAADITAARGLSILYINGQAASEKIGTNNVKPGFTQVIVRFNGKVGSGGSETVFTSKPYILQFDAKDDSYVIKPPQLYTENAAELEFDKAQPGWVLEQNGTAVAYEQEVLPGKQGFLPYSGMDDLVAKHNQMRGLYFNNGELMDAPVAAEVAVVPAAAAKVSGKPATAAAVDVKNVEQLKAWYLKSSKEERKEFRRWMIDQE